MYLGFEKIALDAFQFLQAQYGFRCVEFNQWNVRYESESVFVSVYFDGTRSFELGCSFGRLNDLKKPYPESFDFGDLLRCEVGSVEGSSFQVTTSDALKKFTNLLAEKLERHGSRILVGDDSAFDLILKLRDQANLEYAREERLEQIRHSLEKAWRAKEYQKVVELLAPVQEWLTPSEVKKLEYARKRL